MTTVTPPAGARTCDVSPHSALLLLAVALRVRTCPGVAMPVGGQHSNATSAQSALTGRQSRDWQQQQTSAGQGE